MFIIFIQNYLIIEQLNIKLFIFNNYLHYMLNINEINY